jgi:hypothetical protein
MPLTIWPAGWYRSPTGWRRDSDREAVVIVTVAVLVVAVDEKGLRVNMFQRIVEVR